MAISFGIQSYWGGLAANVVLSAIFPSFQHMPNTLPESAEITTKQLIGFIIYICVFTPLMLIHPSKYQKFLWVSFGGIVATLSGLFIWAVAANGGASVMPAKVAVSSRFVFNPSKSFPRLLNLENQRSIISHASSCKRRGRGMDQQ